MPPRYAYWTILVDEQPTAFRAGVVEDLMPTFKRLKEKNPTARMVWFQNGKIWNSRLEAQEAMRERGLRGREGDKRQGGFRDRDRGPRREPPPESRDSSGKLEWQPKSASGPRVPRPSRAQDRERPKFTPKTDRPAGSRFASSSRDAKPAWKAKPATGERRPSGKLEWQPKSSTPATSAPREKRKWVPKEEYKKAQGIEARRDKNWRPGGEHKDPRQKYKDAKKAKWTRFKQTVRKRWEGKQGKKKSGE